MKIAIASDDGSAIVPHFGRTRGFVVFEVGEKTVTNREYRPNTFTGHARGLEHAGHEVDRHGPILTALSDCRAVIANGMGRRIYDDLKRVGIEVIITDETEVEKALTLYLNGMLVDRPERGCSHPGRQTGP